MVKYIYSSFYFLSLLLFQEAMLENSYAQTQEFLIVANETVEITSAKDIAAIEIRNLYLKESEHWRDGTKSQPFARPAQSQPQIAFEKHILKMSNTELQTHWLKLKQLKGETSPRAISSISILLRQLERKKGAFAIMQSGEYTPRDQTKIIYRFNSE